MSGAVMVVVAAGCGGEREGSGVGVRSGAGVSSSVGSGSGVGLASGAGSGSGINVDGGAGSGSGEAGDGDLGDGSGEVGGADIGDGSSPLLVGISAHKAAVCACADVACTDAAMKDLVVWMRDSVALIQDAGWGTTIKYKRLLRDLKRCRRTLLAQSRGGGGFGMRSMQDFKTAMCACSDGACVQRVTDEMTRWSKQFATTTSKDQKIDPTTKASMDSLVKVMTDCARRAMSGGSAASAEPAGTTPVAPTAVDPWQ